MCFDTNARTNAKKIFTTAKINILAKMKILLLFTICVCVCVLSTDKITACFFEWHDGE